MRTALAEQDLIDTFITRNKSALKRMDDLNYSYTPCYLRDYECLKDSDHGERRRAVSRILGYFFGDGD
jgi:hypothetical protein